MKKLPMPDFNESDYVYQSFWFQNEIKNHFYAGDGFINHREDMELEESFDLAVDMIGDKEAFMPGLVSKIEGLLGKGNFIYDYWEFGEKDFSLYWWIRKDVYQEKMKLIEKWVQYEELEELIELDIKE